MPELEVWIRPPTLGAMVHYRGKYGIQAWRTAMVTVTDASLHPAGLERSDDVPPLDSDRHVHLHVFTPNPEEPIFLEFNVPYGDDPGCWRWPS